MAQDHPLSGEDFTDYLGRRIIEETFSDFRSASDDDREDTVSGDGRDAFDYWVGVRENDVTIFRNTVHRVANESRGRVPVGAPDSELDDRMAARDALWAQVVDFLQGFVDDARAATYENWSRATRDPIRRTTPRAPQYRGI